MKVKICGIKDTETASKAVEYGADALGFVFAESKRKITPEQAKEIISHLPAKVMKIGVFVNEDINKIEEIADYCGLTHIQLHGDETPQYIEIIRYPVIKAFSIGSIEDLKQIQRFSNSFILLDSPKGQFNGGTGMAFEWAIINSVDFSKKKLILAGGLNPYNVDEAITTSNPYMVDVSSGVETEGKKDLAKIKEFIRVAKQSRRNTI